MSGEINPKRSELNKAQWSERAAQIVVDATDSLREKGISPIYRITRWLIYGFFGLALLLVVGTLFVIGAIRLLTVYAFGHHVWITYLVLGFIFAVLGFFLWSRRIKKSS